jgi:hypothetical protein
MFNGWKYTLCNGTYCPYTCTHLIIFSSNPEDATVADNKRICVSEIAA